MGYDHSCFDEQAGPAACESFPEKPCSQQQTPDVVSEAKELAPVIPLLPLEAQRLIWEGAIVLVVAPEGNQHQESTTASIGLHVEICLQRPWARELKRLVADRSLPILCSEDDPELQQRITRTLQLMGFQHIFTIKPI